MFSERLESRYLLSAGFNATEGAGAGGFIADATPAVQFGLVNGTRIARAFATAADGTRFIFSLSGLGTGSATPDGDGFHVDLTGTDARSSLTITSNRLGGLITGISADGSLKNLSAKKCSVGGDISIAGTLAKATMFAISSQQGQTIRYTIGGAQIATSMTVALVSDLMLSSAASIRSLTVGKWLNLNADDDSVTAPTIGTLAATGGKGMAGDFQANVTLTARVPVSLRLFKINGDFANATLRAAGGIRTARLRSISNSKIYVGADPNSSGIPYFQSPFVASVEISSLTLTGRGIVFGGSVVAPRIGSIRTGIVAWAVTTDPHAYIGIVAMQIKSYVRLEEGKRSVKLHNLHQQGDFDIAGTNYRATIVP